VLGISDGGAHCGMICDASAPTYLLAHFVRDRSRGPRIGLEHAVHLQTRRTAELYGLRDRGLIAPGLRADLNLIDFNALALPLPAMVYDLPANGQRLIQRAHGYHSTVLRGQITFEDGVATGALPGQLVRGQQRAR
jgi:N-acyl-D-aspartate/D-glutamate deacylase